MTYRLLLTVLVLAGICSASEKYTVTQTHTWEYASGGRLELHLKNGDVRIQPDADSRHISLTFTSKSGNSDFAGKVRADFTANASGAVLSLYEPRGGRTDVELKVPSATDLYVRVRGGDITIGPVTGNKDIETMGGDIQISVIDKTQYRNVDASTHFGDVMNSPFGQPKGRLGESVKYQDHGAFRLHAHTFAGDVIFKGPKEANDAAIDAIEGQFVSALRNKDTDLLMSNYGPDAQLSFGNNSSSPYTSLDAFRAKWHALLNKFQHAPLVETKDPQVESDGDMAFGHRDLVLSGDVENGKKSEVTIHKTDSYRKVDGKWRVVQEHVLLNVD